MRPSTIDLWMKYRSATMCNGYVFEANLEIAERVRHVPGAVVECGTWRGGMIAAIAESLGPQRHYVLADSFQGLPPAQPIDGPAALKWQAEDPLNCRADVADVRGLFHKLSVEGHVGSYQIVEGWFHETLPSLRTGGIALLRLDADWHASTLCCLTNLWNSVVSGGIVIVDDYYVWDGCARAVHEFLVTVGAAERIHEHGQVAYIVRGL